MLFAMLRDGVFYEPPHPDAVLAALAGITPAAATGDRRVARRQGVQCAGSGGKVAG